MIIKTKQKGWMLYEVIVSMAIIAIMLGTLSMLMNSSGKYNAYQLDKQRCIIACQGQLDSITQTGEPLTQEEIQNQEETKIKFQLLPHQES